MTSPAKPKKKPKKSDRQAPSAGAFGVEGETMDSKIKSALDAAGTAADYSARATYQRGYDAGVIDAKNTISVCGERDAAIARADAAEAREWALGVQVVAQAARLRLADELAVALRYYADREYHSSTAPDSAIQWRADAALAAWDAVPGMEP